MTMNEIRSVKREIQGRRYVLMLAALSLTILGTELSNVFLAAQHTKSSTHTDERTHEEPTNMLRHARSSDHRLSRMLPGEQLGVCLSPSCFPEVTRGLSRAFPDKTNHTAWIIKSKASLDRPTCAGIIYVKNFKAASSTASGVALRIAMEHGSGQPPQNSHNPRKPAWVKFSHVPGHNYATCDPDRTLLFTSIRDPAGRAISRIFYTAVTQHGASPTDDKILHNLRSTNDQFGAVSHEGGGYQVNYVSMHKRLETSWTGESPSTVENSQQVETYVQEIVNKYDFLLVAERMEESLVAMALVLDIDVSDVLVMDAKQNAGKDYLYFHQRSKRGLKEFCKLSVKSFRSEVVKEYLTSPEWYAKNYGDYILHSAANQSLDLTIERLGRDRFDAAMAEYKRLKIMANQICANETVSHCSPEGKPQRELSRLNCYSDDSGCGFACIDKMLAAEKRQVPAAA